MSLARLLAPLALIVGAALPAAASEWKIVPEASSIGFSGTHAGRDFSGRFETWSGIIVFDPAALDAARARIEVDLASATTGDATYDGALPKDDWFNVAVAPTGIYETTGFTANGGDGYDIAGTLEIRGVSVPVAIKAEITIDGDRATMTGTAVLNRMDYKIGVGSDASGSWVSLEIPLELKVTAQRMP